MKRVLIYKGEDNLVIWDASTKELLEKAYLSLFNHFDKTQEFYADLNDGELFLEEEELKKKEALKDIDASHPLYYEAQSKIRFLDNDRRELEDRKLQLRLLGKAREGDSFSAKKILEQRRDYEYENWELCDVEED